MTFEEFRQTENFKFYCNEIKRYHKAMRDFVEIAKTECPSGDWEYTENGLIYIYPEIKEDE